MIKLMDAERQHKEHTDEYEQAVLDVLRSGNYIMGDVVEHFEREFAEYIGVKYAISVGNGTDALQIALWSIGIGAGDEVITTPFTFFATAEAIASVGAVPVFTDIDPETYCIDVNQIEDKITDRTKAILPVHIFGQPSDMDEINKIAMKYNLKVIEDCAQSTGALYRGKKTGALGDVGCFSFFPTKNLGCAGDGGMITTDDDCIAEIAKAIRIHGSGISGMRAFNYLNGADLKEDKDYELGQSKYYNFLIGRNSRLDSVQAAILSRKLKYLPNFNKRRREIAKYYTNSFQGTELVTPKEKVNLEHSYSIYSLRHPNKKEIIAKLNELGIGTGQYYPIPLHEQKVFLKLGYRHGDFPVTEEICRTIFQIPIYPELTKAEREYIVDNVNKSCCKK